MAKQVIVSGQIDDLHTTDTKYNSLSTGLYWSTEGSHYGVFPCAGTLRNFRVKLDGAPDAGNSYALTVRKNGGDTSLTVTIADSDTTAIDTAHDISIAAGDYVTIKSVPSSTPTARTAIWSLEFEATNDGDTVLFGGSSGTMNTSGTYYLPVAGKGVNDSSEQDRQIVMPTAGTLTGFYVILDNSPGEGKSYAFTIRKNGGDEGNTVTIADSDTTGNTTNSISVDTGDKICVKMVPAGTPSARRCGIGITFLASTKGEFIVAMSSDTSLNAGVTEYGEVSAGDSGWDGTESNHNRLANAFTITGIRGALDGSPGSGNSYTFTLRQNGGDSGLAATVADTNDTFNAESDVTINDGDILTTKVVPTSGPTTREVMISYAGYKELLPGVTSTMLSSGMVIPT